MAKLIENKSVRIGLWVLLFIVLIGIIIYFYLKYKNENPPVINLDGNPNSQATPTDSIDKNKILVKGNRGNTVLALQKAINAKIIQYGLTTAIPVIAEDKIFGNETNNALNKLTFQVYNSENGNVSVSVIENGDFSQPPGQTGGFTGSGSSGGGSSPVGKKVYSMILPGSPVYLNFSDFYPYRYAGADEYIGIYKEVKKTWLGTPYVITTQGNAIALEYTVLKDN